MPMLVRTAAVDSDAWMLTGATSVNADSAQEDENRCLIPPGNAGEFLGVHSYIPPFIQLRRLSCVRSGSCLPGQTIITALATLFYAALCRFARTEKS